MKNSHLSLLVLIFSTNFICSAGRIFLENQYGAPFIYKVGRRSSYTNGRRDLEMMQPANKEIRLNKEVRVLLGVNPIDSNEKNLWVNDVMIRPDDLSLANFTSLSLTLNDIHNYSTAMKSVDKDVIIVVMPPKKPGASWHVTFQFETPTTVLSW